jgi:hypothetical protein
MFALVFVLSGAAHANAQDLSVVAFAAPQAGCALGNSEIVTIRLFNYGSNLPAGSAFNVTYTINAGAPTTESVMLAATLLENSTFTYTFATPANLSTPGTYTLGATVWLPGDINPLNDAYPGWIVGNMAPSVGGAISAPGTPGSSGTLTLNSVVGDVLQWEESDDGGLRWYALANTTTTQAYADLRAPAQFRARVRNAPCAEALSNIVTVSP